MLPVANVFDRMLLCYNRCREANQYRVYPWVHQYCNNMSNADQVRPAQFPDVSPADMPSDANFSMAAGDFLEVYEDPGFFWFQLNLAWIVLTFGMI